MYLFSAGSGKYAVTAKVHVLDEGVSVTLYGGERSHIGSVAIAVPRLSLADPEVLSATTSVYNLVGHKDDEVARPAAEKIAKNINQVVVVTAGIHVEDATKEDIVILLKNTEELVDAIVVKLKKTFQRAKKL
ncbi:hypothetical protein [Zhaonella formicivorans]|jgi:hypothetical protein|uniref:prenylated flavin chaperone LpdD n=1 Tax=Zhaonella formicivorans TaxID=2528593 RepID=UPI0010DD17D7|nr:hypothetical protein [Zhaonella formicivorans]